MKRAKIMLMAIAVFAVVGGALAFKAANTIKHPFFGCGTSVVAGQQVTGCFSQFLTPVTTIGGITQFPYNAVTKTSICVPNPNVLVTCGSSNVISSGTE